MYRTNTDICPTHIKIFMKVNFLLTLSLNGFDNLHSEEADLGVEVLFRKTAGRTRLEIASITSS